MRLFIFSANPKHHQSVHNFETRLSRSKHHEDKEKFQITKRGKESKGTVLSLKRQDITKVESKTEKLKTPKNVIETANAFGHLSELLGLKGSFIPSQSKQKWMEDEEERNNPDSNNDVSSYEQQAEQHHQMHELGAEKGTLPLDISPQQAALITSTADRNSQRRKFLQWEKEGGSMDTRHFPSMFIKGQRSVEGLEVDADAAKRVSTEHSPSNEKHDSDSFHGQEGKTKDDDHTQDSDKDKAIFSDVASKDKKGYMGYISSQFGISDENRRLSNELGPHSFLGTAFHSANDPPLSHEMINKLQLDPAWDAMEAKILAQNGRKVMPMPLPVSKIDREMMPPLGEPVGQAYLPSGHQSHAALVSNFHKAAGFMTQPLRGDLHPSSYYSHFQPTDQGLPQTINVGGSLGKIFSCPLNLLSDSHSAFFDHNLACFNSMQFWIVWHLVFRCVAKSGGGGVLKGSTDFQCSFEFGVLCLMFLAMCKIREIAGYFKWLGVAKDALTPFF